jgi:hypothetical protein
VGVAITPACGGHNLKLAMRDNRALHQADDTLEWLHLGLARNGPGQTGTIALPRLR